MVSVPTVEALVFTAGSPRGALWKQEAWVDMTKKKKGTTGLVFSSERLPGRQTRDSPPPGNNGEN